MERNVTVPSYGEDIPEVEISVLFVKEGDTVQEDTVVAEVLADKAAMELRADCVGTVTKVHQVEGSIVKIGETVVTIESADN